VSSHMQRYESGSDLNELWSNDDELGRLLRWSLTTSIGNAEPSPEAWHMILERVREQATPGCTRTGSRCSSAPLASLVQTAVVGCVLVTLGLGMQRDATVARRSLEVKGAPASETLLVSDSTPAQALGGGAPGGLNQERPFRVGGKIREATLPS
jgi:hypothetical protein